MNTLIDHTGWYSFCWLAFYASFGMLCYILDRMYMPGFFTWTYNLFHAKERQLVKPIGFIYGHKTSYKFIIATIVSTLQSFSLFFFTQFHSNPFVELVLWFIEIPAMVIGFWFGFLSYPLWERRKILYTAIDKLDQKVEERAHKQEKGASTEETVAAPPTPEPVSQAAAPVSSPEPERSSQPTQSARERLASYAAKRTS